MEDFLNSTKEASKEIYLFIKESMSESFFKYKKIGAGGDKSSLIDLYAEEIYVKYLKKYGKIVSEESGIIGEGNYEIILDPIDGSDNLLSGFPYFGSSIAIKKDKKVIFSFIVNFSNGEFFVKKDGFYKRGVLFEDNLKEIESIKEPKIGIFEKAYANPLIVKSLKNLNIKFRSPGAVALSLAYARYVKFVLFIGKIREYDVAAGIHQCEDLYKYIEKNVILVSKDREVFGKIKDIIPF